ncbi:hypothetical protein EVA_10836 [gut metagenome]|uniref:Uncharacterized protein n=1 Tax=gut metagenome TaxID=749906 RepID=J9GML2_9ZZZZ
MLIYAYFAPRQYLNSLKESHHAQPPGIHRKKFEFKFQTSV